MRKMSKSTLKRLLGACGVVGPAGRWTRGRLPTSGPHIPFHSVAGYTVHEEFAHPTQGTVWGRDPTISADDKGTFPCLTITGSNWLKLLQPEIEINYTGAVHYRLCSNFPVVDVVAGTEPNVRWFRRPASAQNIPGPDWAVDADE